MCSSLEVLIGKMQHINTNSASPVDVQSLVYKFAVGIAASNKGYKHTSDFLKALQQTLLELANLVEFPFIA